MATAARSAPEGALDISVRVAHGGMASIYLATLDRDGEQLPVAVKVLHSHLAEDPHFKRMFLHEAKLGERLDHPNVVHVYDHGEDATHGTFIVMDYVRGADLAGVLKAAGERRKRIDPRVVARLVVDLCRGLHAAHELATEDGAPLRLVHRDVSPHNLLVGDDGIARLTDFGIAKSDERYTMTRPGQLKGKLAYMSPEQLAHEDETDRRVDVFAAGVVLWECLLTRRLFKADDEVATINKVLLSKVDPPSRYYPELAPLDPVVAKALAREPEDRYPTAGAMADAIEEAMEELGGIADRATCVAELGELLEDELARRSERIERASMTPTAPASVDSLSIELTPEGGPSPSGRSVGALIGLLVLLIGVCGTAIAWLVLSEDDAPPASREAPAESPPPAEPTPEPPPVEARSAPPGPATPEREAAPDPTEPAAAPAPRRARTAPEPPSPYDEAEAPREGSDGLPPMEGTANPYGD